jgi:hypothetical protein
MPKIKMGKTAIQYSNWNTSKNKKNKKNLHPYNKTNKQPPKPTNQPSKHNHSFISSHNKMKANELKSWKLHQNYLTLINPKSSFRTDQQVQALKHTMAIVLHPQSFTYSQIAKLAHSPMHCHLFTPYKD